MADGLVRAAVAVFQLAGLCACGQRGQLVAEADAEGRDAGGEHFADVRDDLDVLGRVAGAVGEHEAVGIERGQLGSGRRAGQHGHAAAALLQAAHNVVLAAQVEQRHVQRRVTPCTGSRRLIGHGLAAGDVLDSVDNGVGGDLGQQRGLLLRFGVGVELGGDRAVHNAALPQGAGQAAGVDALNADDAVLFQEGIQRFLTAEVGRGLARLAHNVAPGPNLRALDILTVHAVVADERIGLGDDLAVVAGVGQGFLKADHTGCKDDLTDGGTGAAYADAAEHPAIGQYQICLHSW